MKILIFIVLSSFIAIACGVFVPPRPGHKKQHLLGEKECTYGPSYWCQNLTNAANCHATKHCIQTVWLHKQYPEDHTSICDTCKEMVKEARDQLESNETQELIKEVFEGSCALLRLKPIVKECDKIADDFIPELIDTLASEMNPQTVCAVAGLCNNPRIYQLLAEAGEQISLKPSDITIRNRCDDCNTVLDVVVTKFKAMSRDDFLESLLEVCGQLGSFSDACSNTVIKYFSDIYSFLQENFNADDFCLLSGECYANFHKHEIEITPMSKIGYVPVAGEKEDLPCELCEQLVTHLREVLIANTTEAEFKQVLEGICKQTNSFKDECLSIVDQYYDLIYNFLVNNLNATATCQLINICPKNIKSRPLIAPLLPVDTAEVALKLNQQPEHVYIPKDDIVVKVMQPRQEIPSLSADDMQLPIDLLVPPHQQVYNQEFCIFCEYFLHYLQKAITDPTVEDKVKKVIDEACSKLPKSINETCVEFVNTYEPALVAILAQEIDPSQICPEIHACPTEKSKDVEIFLHTQTSSKCPLCLYAVTELEDMIKGDKSKDKIKEALTKVCNRLPGKLKPECTDFVNTYTNELIEMLVADFKPQEVCVFLKLCTDTTPVSEVEYEEQDHYGGDTETNVIYDNTVNGHPIKDLGNEECILCEFVMEAVEKKLKDKNTDDEIKNIVHHICNALPGTIKDDCNKFVNQYADAIIILLQEAADPQTICTYIGLCKKWRHPLEFVREEVSKCGVCRTAADIVQTILKNPKIDQNMNHIFEKTCRGVPSEMKKTCMETFFKNDELDYTNVVQVFNMIEERSMIPYGESNVKSIDCFICKLVVNAVKIIIANRQITVNMIKHILETVCQGIPIWIRSPCNDFVHKYMDPIAQLIFTMVDKDLICPMLKVCESNSLENTAVEVMGVNKDIASTKRDLCTPCKIFSSVLKSILENPEISSMLKDGINQLCNKMPDPLKNVCTSELKTHWKDFENMLRRFNADQFCRNSKMCSVWPEISDVGDTGNDICTPCKILSSVLKSILENPEISNMLKDGINQLCNKMPDPLKNVCNSELRTHWKDFENMLRNFNADQFCKNTKMCSVWPEISDVDDTGKDICTPCKILSSVLKSILENPEISSMLKDGINQLCNKMPDPLKNVCNSELRTHWKDFENMLRNFNAEQFCRNTKMCSIWPEMSYIDNIGKDICTPCKILSTVMQSILENPEISKTIREGIHNTCNKMPNPLNNICHSELQTHWNDFINMLKQFNADKFCRDAKMCTVWKELTNLDDTERCDSCKMVVNMVKTLLLISPDVAQTIKNTILDTCGIMSPRVKSVCFFIIRRYWDGFIFKLKKYEPYRFCTYIKMCSRREDNDKEIQTSECTSAVGNIKSFAEHPLLRINIISILRRNCENKLTYLKNDCLNLVNKHGKIGIDYLLNMVRQLDEGKMCSVQEESEVELFTDFSSKSCMTCQLTISTFRDIFKSSWIREEVKLQLMEACDQLLIISSTCKNIVGKYTDTLIKMLGNHVNSEDICKAIYLCENKVLNSENDKSVIQFTENELEQENIDDNECQTCIKMATAIKDYAQRTIMGVYEVLKSICNDLGSKYKDTCLKEVQHYWGEVINLVKKFDPQNFCKSIKMCPTLEDVSVVVVSVYTE